MIVLFLWVDLLPLTFTLSYGFQWLPRQLCATDDSFSHRLLAKSTSSFPFFLAPTCNPTHLHNIFMC